MLIADSCNCDAFSGLTARLILKVKSDDSGNTVYATVVGECGRNAWLPVVVAFMQNNKKVTRTLLQFKKHATCLIKNGILEGMEPVDS